MNGDYLKGKDFFNFFKILINKSIKYIINYYIIKI